MDSDIGNFEKKGTRRKIVCFVCGFRHKTNYFSALVIGCFEQQIFCKNISK